MMRELFDTGQIELPEREATAIRRPAEPISEVEFLFVDPIGCSVDQGLGPIGGERANRAWAEFLDIEIVASHIPHSRPVGRELGKHQGGCGSIATQFLQSSARPVKSQ